MRFPLAATGLAVTLLITGCTADQKKPDTPSSSTPPPADNMWQAGRSQPVADKLYPEYGNAGLDVLHYDLKLDWNPAAKVLTGTAAIRIRPVTTAAELNLDFTGLTVDAVTVDDRPATGTVTGHKLTVPTPVVADRPVTLVVKYHGTPKAVPWPSLRGDATEGIGLRPDKNGGIWTMQEPWGALTWYPANELPSDKALYDIAVTVPNGWAAAASGTPGPEQDGTYRYAHTDPVAAYLVTLSVDRYRKVTQSGPHGLPLTYWIRPKTDDELLPVLQKSPQILTWLEERLGPYPFPTAGTLINGSISGMETQQMVSMGRGLSLDWKGQRDTYWEQVLVHEYAHHWFGDTVTTSNWADLWLNEGPTMYMQELYEQQRDRISDAQLKEQLRQHDAVLRKELGPPGKPDPKNFGASNVYRCAAAMLNDLHTALGDARFFALMRDWAQQNRNTNQDRSTFIAFVNRTTGTDFTTMINTWLDSPTTPNPTTTK